jgi:hypothetical protein
MACVALMSQGRWMHLSNRARTREEPDSAYLFRLLRPSRERSTSETDSENDGEPDPPHGHLGGGRMAGSLAEGHDAHQHNARLT